MFLLLDNNEEFRSEPNHRSGMSIVIYYYYSLMRNRKKRKIHWHDSSL